MHTGKLIEDLFVVVERAEREASQPRPANDGSRNRDSRPSPRETETGAAGDQRSRIGADEEKRRRGI